MEKISSISRKRGHRVIFQKKPVEQFLKEREKSTLNKNLGVKDLTFLGVGGIIGAEIFVLTGIAAAHYAGPAIAVSFAIAGFLCILVGLSYSEFASMIPASGSVYSYTLASLGEGFAFLCGWSLLLAYTVTGSAVAVGFSGYLAGVLKSYGWIIPDILLKTPAEGGLINLPAVLIVLVVAAVLIRGTEQSAKLNFALVLVTLSAIITFVCIAAPHAQTANLELFAPFGVKGILSGAAIVFFSYMGFDAVASSAEECKDPEHSLPIGIILSVMICMCLYIAMALSLTAAVNYTQLDTPEPVAYVLRLLGWGKVANLIAVGAIAGIITTLIVYLFGQSRVFFAISRDGMLPKKMGKIHPKYHTPYLVTAAGALMIAGIAGFVPLMHIVELSNTGTLAVFLVNFINLMVMRRKHPEVPRKFRCPALYIVAPLGIAVCFYLIYELSTLTHILFAAWILLGLEVYETYGVKHSSLNTEPE